MAKQKLSDSDLAKKAARESALRDAIVEGYLETGKCVDVRDIAKRLKWSESKVRRVLDEAHGSPEGIHAHQEHRESHSKNYRAFQTGGHRSWVYAPATWWLRDMVNALREAQPATEPAAPPSGYSVSLQLLGEKPRIVSVKTLAEASSCVTTFQDAQGAGASDLGAEHGEVFDTGVPCYRVSYNGRIWPLGTEGRRYVTEDIGMLDYPDLAEHFMGQGHDSVEALDGAQPDIKNLKVGEKLDLNGDSFVRRVQ